MRSWQLQEAKAKFSELLNAVLRRGPQVVTRRGVALAVIVPIQEWQRLQEASRPSLKTWLLGPGPRFENIAPERGRRRRRPPVVFE